jgi:hypothetical protein
VAHALLTFLQKLGYKSRPLSQGEVEMRIRSWILIFTVILSGFIVLPEIAQAQLVLYDNFNSGKINPEKWNGFEPAGTAAAPNAESGRRVVEKKLQLHLTSYGETSSDTGGPSGGNQRLRFNNPTPITGIQAKVAIQKAVAQGCAANLTDARSRVQITGAFFNDGSSSGSGDETGNFQPSIEMRLDSNGNRNIFAFVQRCDDPQCDNTTTIVPHLFTTSWTLGAFRTLKLVWDEANDQFLFTVNPGTPAAETANLSYTGFSDANPPENDRKEIRINNDPVNCTAGRTRALTTVLFDNVMVNP